MFKLLNGVSATGASSSVFLNQPVSEHMVEVDYVDANASISALVIKLQASGQGRSVEDDDAVWFDLATYTFNAADLTAKSAMFHVVNKPAKRIRVNITTLTGAGVGDAITARYTPKNTGGLV